MCIRDSGYTEHSKKHAAKVAATAGKILKDLGYKKNQIELAKIAGYMHDIGNSINRHDHAQSGGILAYQILKELKMPLEDALVVSSAIGNHDEGTGTAIDVVSAALILADKTDVRRNRVRNQVIASFDAHDRVNYACLLYTSGSPRKGRGRGKSVSCEKTGIKRRISAGGWI